MGMLPHPKNVNFDVDVKLTWDPMETIKEKQSWESPFLTSALTTSKFDAVLPV